LTSRTRSAYNADAPIIQAEQLRKQSGDFQLRESFIFLTLEEIESDYLAGELIKHGDIQDETG
jgi:hypothetical protein